MPKKFESPVLSPAFRRLPAEAGIQNRRLKTFCFDEMLIVFTTTANNDEAEDLARKLVEQKLAACVQIMSQVTSFYQWEGKVQKDEECLLLIKTLPEKFEGLEAFIKANHSYSVPEIVAVNAENVSKKYLEWLSTSVS